MCIGTQGSETETQGGARLNGARREITTEATHRANGCAARDAGLRVGQRFGGLMDDSPQYYSSIAGLFDFTELLGYVDEAVALQL